MAASTVHLFDNMCRALASFTAIYAGKVARAHMCRGRQGRNRQVAVEIFANPSVEIIETTASIASLSTQFNAEL